MEKRARIMEKEYSGEDGLADAKNFIIQKMENYENLYCGTKDYRVRKNKPATIKLKLKSIDADEVLISQYECGFGEDKQMSCTFLKNGEKTNYFHFSTWE